MSHAYKLETVGLVCVQCQAQGHAEVRTKFDNVTMVTLPPGWLVRIAASSYDGDTEIRVGDKDDGSSFCGPDHADAYHAEQDRIQKERAEAEQRARSLAYAKAALEARAQREVVAVGVATLEREHGPNWRIVLLTKLAEGKVPS